MAKKAITVSCVFAGKGDAGKIIEEAFIRFLRRKIKCEKM